MINFSIATKAKQEFLDYCILISILYVLMLIPQTAFASSSSSFSYDAFIANMKFAAKSMITLVESVSYVIGLTMVVRGVMMYKIFGSQTMASTQRGEFAGPLVWIIVGCILIYLPSTYTTSFTTIFGTENLANLETLIGYSQVTAQQKWKDLSGVILLYMRLVGLIAFIRGFVILGKMGHSGSQPGSVGKGIIHIIGGVLLINIVDTVNMLACTFGFQAACS